LDFKRNHLSFNAPPGEGTKIQARLFSLQDMIFKERFDMRDRNTWKVMMFIVLCGVVIGLSGCENTWHGAGRDIENVGDSMQDDYN
jgi:predicted small secreted protein